MRYARIALLSAAATCLLPAAAAAIAQAKPAAERGARQKISSKDLKCAEARLQMTPFVAPAAPKAPRAKNGRQIG
jgi:hypothetical protein